jgi:ketosteroid isomerase-like protein
VNTVEEIVESVTRDFLKALEAKHTEQVLACFTEDSIWISPEGTFTGKASIKKYLEWQFSQAEEMKIKECGNGIIVMGNRAFIEHSIAFRRNGDHIEYVVLCALEMKNDLVHRIRTVYDRLSLEQKLAKGRISRWAINHTLRQAEKKLFQR